MHGSKIGQCDVISDQDCACGIEESLTYVQIQNVESVGTVRETVISQRFGPIAA
jgi:hypothetical protein